jgi:two-component system sensor histidine kinase UhpB
MTVSETPGRDAQPPTRIPFLNMLRQPFTTGVAAFILGAALTTCVAVAVRDEWQQNVQARFGRRAEQVTTMLSHELQANAAILQSARGAVYLPADLVSTSQWQDYVASLDLDHNPSPIRRLGYVPLTPAARQALAGDAAGMPMLVASLSAPPSWAPATTLGPRDAAAIRRTAQSSEIALASRPIEDSSDTSHPALAMLLAVYVPRDTPTSPAARIAGTDGILFATLDPRRMLQRALEAERGLDVRLSIAGNDRPIYAIEELADEAAGSPDLLRETDRLSFGGTTLTLAYSADGRPGVTGAQRAAGTVLAAGLAASLAFSLLAYALARGRLTREVDSAAHSSGLLNEARMMAIIRSSMEAIITIDERQKVVIFNPKAEEIFGVSAMDAIGGPLSRFIPERFRGAHAKHVEQFGVTGVSERQMGRQLVLFGLRSSGEEFPIEASISQIRDASGKLYTVMLRDITERLRADNALKQSREELRDLSANLQNVREEEKTRIARELHDDLGQQLTALKMDLSVVEQQLREPRDPQSTEVQKHLQGMRRLIDATVASVRRIAADLRPVMLDDLGLVPAIEWLANDFTNRYGIDVDREIDPGALDFTNSGATTVFRIVQEALTNVARHAEATRVVVKLHVDDGFCVLRIADNGHGAVTGGPPREDKSFGLIGIRERAHMLGGTVTIDTAQARGFVITVTLPLASIQQETSET